MSALIQNPEIENLKQEFINKGKQSYESTQKQELSDYVSKRTSEGVTSEEALSDYTFMNNALGQDSSRSNYGSSKVVGAMNRSIESKQKYDDTRTNALGYGLGIKKKWETQVKNDLDSLQQLTHDASYSEWLESLGLNMKNITRLRQGRDAYIEGSMNDMKNEFKGNLQEWEDLKMLREEAGRDYQSKIELVQSEVESLKNNEKIVERAIDNQGNLRVLVEDKNTGQRYMQTFEGFSDPKTSWTNIIEKEEKQKELSKKLNNFAQTVKTAQSGSVINQLSEAYGKRLSEGEVNEEQLKDIIEAQIQKLYNKNFPNKTKEKVDQTVLQEYVSAIQERHKKDNDWVPFN